MRLFVGLVQGDTLIALRVLNKEWNRVADAFIDEGMMIVHVGNDIRWGV